MWGSVYTNCSYRSFVEALDVHDLVILNTTTPTHLSFTGRNAWSLLDLVLVSCSCASLCTSTVTSEFLGSDHSVVLTAVKASTTPEDLGVPKWNFSKADWQKFSAACDHTLGSFSISLDYAYCLFETSVLEAALEAIPQSKRSIKIAVPWWNKLCDIAVKNKKYAFNKMKLTSILRDIILFKRCRAKARRVLLEAKSSSWRKFCTSLTSTTNLPKVCKVIKSFTGNRPPCIIPTLLAQCISVKNKKHKSNVLTNQFALSSSSANYPPRFVNVFLPVKTRLLQQELSLASPIDPRINQAIKERISAVQDSTNTTPRPDNLCYEMFKHLSIKSLEVMLQLFNKIWFTGKILPSWLHSIIVPIAKPNQPSHLPSSYRPISLTSNVCKLWKNGRMSTQPVFGVPQDP